MNPARYLESVTAAGHIGTSTNIEVVRIASIINKPRPSANDLHNVSPGRATKPATFPGSDGPALPDVSRPERRRRVGRAVLRIKDARRPSAIDLHLQVPRFSQTDEGGFDETNAEVAGMPLHELPLVPWASSAGFSRPHLWPSSFPFDEATGEPPPRVMPNSSAKMARRLEAHPCQQNSYLRRPLTTGRASSFHSCRSSLLGTDSAQVP